MTGQVVQTAEYRRNFNGVNATDFAPLLGISPYPDDSPLGVFLKMTGQADPVEETEAMYWGHILEDPICKSWSVRNNKEIRRRNQRIIHPKYPWLGGHIDRDVVGLPEGLEAKLSSADGWGPDGSADIPEHLVPQPHIYMALTGAERWNVTALLWSFGPPKQHDYVIERDDELIGMLIEVGERFMVDHVRKGVPPDPTSSEQANKLWRRSTSGRTKVITPTQLVAMADLVIEKGVEKGGKDGRNAPELTLKAFLEDVETATDEDGTPLYSWKSQTSRRFQQKKFQEDHPELYAEYVGTSSYRVLRLLKAGMLAAANHAKTQEEMNDDD